jgi:O-antigen/teichoic acid export membrane protein
MANSPGPILAPRQRLVNRPPTTSPYNKQGARRATFYTLLLRPPAQIASALSYVLLVRLLSERDYGIYNLFYATLPLVSAAASFGLEHTLRRFQPEYLKKGQNRLADLVVRKIGVIRLLTNAGLLLLILALWQYVAPPFKILEYRDYFWLFAVIVLTHFQCVILTIALSSHLLQKYSLGMQAAFSILKAAGYGLWAFVLDFNLWVAFLVDLGVYLLFYGGLKYYYTFKPNHAIGDIESIPKEEKWRLFRYGAFYNFNDAGSLPLRAQTDNFFIAALLDPIAVGAYSFGTQLSQMISRATPVRMLESVIQPIFFSLDYKNNADRVQNYFSLLMSLGLVVSIPPFAFITCYHLELVDVVFGGQFREYAGLLPLIFLFSAANSIASPINLVAQLKEKAHIVFASRIFSIYNILANLALIPIIGVAGAVVASGTAVLMKNLFIWWFVRDLGKWHGAVRFLGLSAFLWGAFVVLVLVGSRLLPEQPIQQLLIGVPLWCGFFLLHLRTWAFTGEQREIVGKLFSGSESRALRLLGLTR